MNYQTATNIWVLLSVATNHHGAHFAKAFTPPPFPTSRHRHSLSQSKLDASKPHRLHENVAGVVYVNDKCINCAACSNFAPDTFSRSSTRNAHIVHQQPSTANEIQSARQALAACPVAAIRLETLAQKRHGKRDKTEVDWTEQDQWLVQQMSGKATESDSPLFPRQFLDNVENIYWLGHHNERSFGAVPYLLHIPSSSSWIMIDTPKYSPSAVRAIASLTGPNGPDYAILTHVDDTADHDMWAKHFDGMSRVFHSGDLGKYNWLGDDSLNEVEVLLQPSKSHREGHLTAYSLDGTVLSEDWMDSSPKNLPLVILHTPGHSPGSITVYLRPQDDIDGVLFTGDTYAYTTRTNAMTAFSQYGNNSHVQSQTLQALLRLDWSIVAPGHGHPRDYRGGEDRNREEEMQAALHELVGRR